MRCEPGGKPCRNAIWQGSMAELEERLDPTERLSTKERAGSQF
ncbi:MAG: hypothetical protein O7F70_00710 [Gemmatimonadetes bacterium]|nr:hypothetical protein [Gemmatimonadota bacterium]